jgi:hypothetical protein
LVALAPLLRQSAKAREKTRGKWAKKWRKVAGNGAFAEGLEAPFRGGRAGRPGSQLASPADLKSMEFGRLERRLKRQIGKLAPILLVQARHYMCKIFHI